MRGHLRHWLTRLAIAAALVCPIITWALYIHAYAVDLPWLDDWELVPLLAKLHQGQLDWRGLFAQNYEHRFFFPNLLLVLLGKLTAYRQPVAIYLQLPLAVAVTSAFCLDFLRHRSGRAWSWLLLLPAVLTVFSLSQQENLLWSYKLDVWMTLAAWLWAVYLLANSGGRGGKLALAAALGLVASFCSAAGLTVWPVGAVELVLMWRWSPGDRRRACFAGLVLWIVVGVLACALYSLDWHRPPTPARDYFLQHPVGSLDYFLRVLARVLVLDPRLALAVGIGLVCSYAYVLGRLLAPRRQPPPMTLARPVILFTLVNAFLLVVGRLGFDQDVHGRYATLMMPGIVGLYLATVLWADRPRRRCLPVALAALMIVGAATTANRALSIGRKERHVRLSLAHELRSYWRQPDGIVHAVHPWPCLDRTPPQRCIRARLGLLFHHRLGMFRDGPAALPPPAAGGEPPTFRVEAVNGAPFEGKTAIARADPVVVVDGWVVDRAAGAPASEVRVALDEIEVPARYPLLRKDVARSLGNPAFAESEFQAYFVASHVGKGRHRITLRIVSADGRATHHIDPGLAVEIR
jgi:hypothetical protein